MDLLERYLQAIGQSLPPATRDDVLNELRANLTAQIDDRAEELARPLTEPELAAILKAHGRPEVVAARYQPQRYLIGPQIYPFYMLTMRRVLPFIVAICVIANFVKIAVTQNGVGSIAEGLANLPFQLIPVIFVWLSVITLIFVILERTYDKFGQTWLNDWNPSKLSPVKSEDGSKQRSLPIRITDLAFHCVGMAYIVEVPRHPYLLFGPAVAFVDTLQVGWAPVWHAFYVALWFLLLAQLGIKIANLFDSLGRWTIPLDLTAKLFSIALTGWLAVNGPYVVATGSRVGSLQLALANHWVGLSLTIVLAIMTLDLAIQAWKYLRTHIPVARLAF
jgi:hypothetical protein